MEIQQFTLNNGIRLVHQHASSPVAHCGVIINTGSRDEEPEQHGMAHLLEHLIFKGTRQRKAHQILSRMENVGGELNAFTTKEETCIFTSFFNNYYARAFDIMTDIIFRSTFPEKEILREKAVIIDEINSYKDSPIEQIFDDFEEMVFKNHPMAKNILGTQETIQSHSRSSILEFFSSHYNTTEMIVSSVGNISFKVLCKYFERFFSDVPESTRKKARLPFNIGSYKAENKKQDLDTYQAHCILGNLAYSNREEKRLILHLLNNILGGPGMNSRLHMALREKNGLAYNIESNYNTYSDIGNITIYFGTDKKDIEKCVRIILTEIKRLKEKPLGTIQMTRAKKQLIGQIAMSAENYESQMIANGRSLLIFGRIDPLEELTGKINAISASELLEVSNEIFDENTLSRLFYY